jgi:uncharacterized protein YacL
LLSCTNHQFIQTVLMLVPGFVLNKLQRIAGSADALRRNRGWRGLEILHRLQDESAALVRVTDADAEGDGVDEKLVSLAKQLGCAVVTNDYNLNRMAELQGVRVLNVNEPSGKRWKPLTSSTWPTSQLPTGELTNLSGQDWERTLAVPPTIP